MGRWSWGRAARWQKGPNVGDWRGLNCHPEEAVPQKTVEIILTTVVLCKELGIYTGSFINGYFWFLRVKGGLASSSLTVWFRKE